MVWGSSPLKDVVIVQLQANNEQGTFSLSHTHSLVDLLHCNQDYWLTDTDSVWNSAVYFPAVVNHPCFILRTLQQPPFQPKAKEIGPFIATWFSTPEEQGSSGLTLFFLGRLCLGPPFSPGPEGDSVRIFGSKHVTRHGQHEVLNHGEIGH